VKNRVGNAPQMPEMPNLSKMPWHLRCHPNLVKNSENLPKKPKNCNISVENCWNMCKNVYSTICEKQFFKKLHKSFLNRTKNGIFGGFFQEFPFISYSKNSRKLFDQIFLNNIKF
jgi:hypothetical protein